MEQHTELKSETERQGKFDKLKKSKQTKRLNTKIKVTEILAAPDYLYLSPSELMRHFTNLATNEHFDHWKYYENYTKIMGYANRSLFETCLAYLKQKHENFVIVTTPLHHTSWRNAIEKYVKPENIHIIDLNDNFNGFEKFPDIDKCDAIIITHLFGQDMDMTGLAEFKNKTGAIVIEDRVQGGSLDHKFSSDLIDISTYSMAMDKKPIALGGAFLYIRNEFKDLIAFIIESVENYPLESTRKRFIELLKKIPTFILYNRRVLMYLFLRILRMLKLNLLDFTNMYRTKNPGFSHNDYMLKPSSGLMKSMSQHYHDHKNMENLFEEKHMLFRSYLSNEVIRSYFPWFRDASLTPYNTIYVDQKYMNKFLKFMNRSVICIIWNPTYKMFNFPYEGDAKYLKFNSGIVYLPSLALMTREEIQYLADRIERFHTIISKGK